LPRFANNRWFDTIARMKAGVYRHKLRNELLYLLIGLAQDHDSRKQVVVYVPLFIRENWDDTPIMTYRSLEDFEQNFEWVSERQPIAEPRQTPHH